MKLNDNCQKWKKEDPKRYKSEEVDFGVCWGMWTTTNEPFWRVSWIANTGELYAVCSRNDKWILLDKISKLSKVEKRMEGFMDKIDEMIITKFFDIEVEVSRPEEMVQALTGAVDDLHKKVMKKKAEKEKEQEDIDISAELKRAIKENKVN